MRLFGRTLRLGNDGLALKETEPRSLRATIVRARFRYLAAAVKQWRAMKLAHQFLIVAGVVVVSGMGLTGWWVGERIAWAVTENTAHASALYMESEVAPLIQELATTDRLSPKTIARLDMILADPLIQERIISMKVWNLRGTIVYSKWKDVIGKSFPLSVKQRKARAGAVAADFGSEPHQEDFYERQVAHHLLEIYAPMRAKGTREIIAIAEFYAKGDRLRTDLTKAARQTWLLVGLATLLMMAALYGIVSRGSRTIDQQRQQLTMQIAQLRHAEDALAQMNQALEGRVAERTRELQQEMKLREETQTALAQAQRMEALGQLTGGLAHDFNNLLTVISGHLELAEAQISDTKVRRSIRQAIEAVEMGASLNRRLLSFARRRKLAPLRLILNDRIYEMKKLLHGTLGEVVTLRTRIEAELWPTFADPGEIDSAIINIAINARDAMPGGGTLTVTTRNLKLDDAAARQADVQAGDYVCMSLSDTGHGMAPEVVRRAIEPFFTTKETGKGTGLGLSSVYGFARQSGGFLEILSEVGKGTTVSLCLPRAAPEPKTVQSASANSEVPTGEGELILLVEDNNRVRQVASALLESLRYNVVEARSGAEAIELLKADIPVALVFSDIVMPGGTSGYDVARWIRDTKPGLKVLLTSGNEGAARRAAGDMSDLKLLSKPYTRAQLGQAIHAALTS